MEQQTTGGDPEERSRAAREFLRAVLHEDGIAAAVEAATEAEALRQIDPISRHLMIVELLEANLYDRLQQPDPFDEQTGDAYWSPDPAESAAPDHRKPGVRQWARFESATVAAHRAVQTSGAVRALAAARYAAFDVPAGTPAMAPADYVEHPVGHVSEFADSFLGPALGLGPHQARRFVEEAAWMRDRTPRLLEEVARQGAPSVSPDAPPSERRTFTGPVNLDAVAAIARELQDARPNTCETVEHAILRRGIHHTSARAAQRSTRTLVTRHEAEAARTTRRRTIAQQHGVWLDRMSTPGLSMVTAVLDTERATALFTAVEDRAHELHRDADDDRTLGQHRTDALFQLALRGVSLVVNLDVVVPDQPARTATPPRPTVPEAFRTSPAAPEAFRTSPALAFHHTGALVLDRLARVVAELPAAKVTTRVQTLAEITGAAADRPYAGYRPPVALRDAVRVRDRTCRHPGCTRPARYTDLDHISPWPAGRTTLTNLHCLCRRHHRAKQAGWKITVDGRGVETWTSPTGRSHLTRPGLIDDLDHAGFLDTG